MGSRQNSRLDLCGIVRTCPGSASFAKCDRAAMLISARMPPGQSEALRVGDVLDATVVGFGEAERASDDPGTPAQPDGSAGPDEELFDTAPKVDGSAAVADSAPEIDLATAMTALAAAVDAVASQASQFHARSEHQEHLIREMQSRIENLQGDQIRVLLKPLIQALATLHSQSAEAETRAGERGDESERDFEFFSTKLEEALSLLDIEPVGAQVGGVFDAKVHHATRVVATDDETRDRTIQRVLRQGFIYTGSTRPLLPAQVSIFKFEPPA